MEGLFNDISSGLSSVGSSISSGLGDISNYLFGSSSNSALKNMYSSSSADMAELPTNVLQNGTGGLFGSIGDGITSGLDYLTKYKDAINTGATVFGAYSDYKAANAMQDYYKAVMAEQARQVAKEEDAIASNQSGFSGSALYNPNKQNTNYYSV